MGGNLSATFTYGHPFLSQASTLPGLPNVFDDHQPARDRELRPRSRVDGARRRASATTTTTCRESIRAFNLLDPVNPGPMELDGPESPNASHDHLPRSPGHLAARRISAGQLPSYSFEQQLTLVTDKHAFKFGGLYATPRGGRLDTHRRESSRIRRRPRSWPTVPPHVDFRPRVDGQPVAPPPTGDCSCRTTGGSTPSSSSIWVSGTTISDGSKSKPADPANPAGFINLDGEPDPSFTFGPPRSPDQIVEDDKGINLGPRIGFAYNPDGNGNTVISGGWGLMFQSIDPQVFEALQIGTTSGVPVNLDLQRCGSGYPRAAIPVLQRGHVSVVGTPPPPPAAPLQWVRLMDPHIQAPYAHVFTVGMQRALGSATVVNAAYLGTRGYNFRLYRTYNQPDRLTGIRPNPNLNQDSYLDDSQEAKYNSLQTSMRQRLSRNLQFNLNYTLSSTRANYDGDNAGRSVNDEVRRTSRTSSTLDVELGSRHRRRQA